MTQSGTLSTLDGIVARLAEAGWKERDGIKEELLAACQALDHDGVIDHLESLKRELTSLEVRWEVDEVIEALTPPPVEEPEEEEAEAEEADDPNKPLTAADLDLVYDDPRGFMLHRTKVGSRWFATQRDPRTGQPQTFELHATEIDQLKQQLQGSPYWVIGAGAG